MGKSYDVESLSVGVLSGERSSLSRAITCIESKRTEDGVAAEALLETLLPKSSRSFRIGITGIPGAGKSSLIEALGLHLLKQDAKARIAVLAIDPSSHLSKGSILADKTRMESLSRHSRVYIRPSPSGMIAGGTAASTQEVILLCEAAGYSYVFVETVGVGQRELSVREIVDCVLVLLLADTGDHWQGIKRGILEIADLVLLHKADGKNISSARAAAAQHRAIIQLTTAHMPGWKVPVHACSSKTGEGLDKLWQAVQDFFTYAKKGHLHTQRREQRLSQLQQQFTSMLLEALHTLPAYEEAKAAAARGESLPRKLAKRLVDTYLKSLK